MNSNSPENEKVILDTPPHVLFLIIPILATIVLWFFYAFLICPFVISPLIDDRCIWVSGLSFTLVIAILFLDWINNRLILTNLRVSRQRGIIGKTIMEIGLDRIQDIKISFGIIGRIFGFGNLEIESAGTLGRIVFRGIPSPRRLKRIITKEIMKSKKAL
jgi:uncharacterized membrane protein YdbT with pleckstrin-like domain